jgi:hypothetical protein
MSPNHPEFYDNGNSTIYNLTAPAGQQIAVYFARFRTPNEKDWVTVTDMGFDEGM